MGLGKFVNGRNQPIGQWKGSWAETEIQRKKTGQPIHTADEMNANILFMKVKTNHVKDLS